MEPPVTYNLLFFGKKTIGRGIGEVFFNCCPMPYTEGNISKCQPQILTM